MQGKYTSTYEKHASMKPLPFLRNTLILGLVLLLSACLKDIKDGNNQGDVNVVSALSVVHASASTPAIDFVLDRQKVNNQDFEFGDRIQYFGVYGGRWPVAIYLENNYGEPILETDIQVQSGQYYTLFFAGEIKDPEGILLQDNIAAPEGNKASLRFVNLSLQAGTVDFICGDTSLAKEKTFGTYTSFQEIDAGQQTLHVLGTNSETVREFEFRAGHVYTIWLKDVLEEPTGEAQSNKLLDMALIDHIGDLQAQSNAGLR